ncbi:MAG TPA: hypothetical protein VKC56_08995 [Gallionellaceae bacterium]|nr:hypothetical protein [Gallionellaceae bacterium]
MSLYSWLTFPQSSAISLIVRPKLSGPGEHWGVHLLDGTVAHSTSDKGPHYVTYEQFTAGKPVKKVREVPMSEHDATLRRIEQEVSGRTGYHLLDNNCETFANRVTGGASESSQTREWTGFLAVLGILALIASAS